VAGRDRLYVPRDYRHCADETEQFDRAVICEGELKAAGLWQVLGAGLGLQVTDFKPPLPPVGVCSFPGITYGKNLRVRGELDIWLKMVKCREVIVAFDSEDKSEKPLKERHASVIWAQYLATDLQYRLHVRTRVCILPAHWRNEKGKADWDGALAMIFAGKIK
jgi:hypothetical protein